MDVASAPVAQDTLHAEVTDALSRGLVTPAEVAGLSDGELGALVALCRDAAAVGELPRAEVLARALVVLSPYWAVAWRLLGQTLQARGDEAAAAWALEAAALLAPPDVAAVQAEQAPVAAPFAQASVLGGGAALMHDGRPLPLTHTPAAQHHDTVGAQRAAAALMTPQSRGDTARWAQTTQELALQPTGTWPHALGDDTAHGQDPLASTGTAVVRRTAIAAPSDARRTSEDALDQTGKILRPSVARAAARRRLGWPITDTWSPDEPTHTAITPR